MLERALVLATGAALLARGRSLLPRTPQDQTLISTGAMLMGGGVGLVAEGAVAATSRLLPGRSRLAAALLLGAGGALASVWASRRPADESRAALIDTAGKVAAVSTAGGELASVAFRRLPGEPRRLLVFNLLATGFDAAGALRALRQRLAEPRDLVKAGIPYEYLTTVSGGDGSLLPLVELDREGRKFLGSATPSDRISDVTGVPAVDPIRVYAGLDSASSPLGRARLAVGELQRLGGFDRRRILVLSPTGAGFVNPVAVETEELMSRGDVASVVVQYSTKRSVRARRHLSRARETTWLLLAELDRALAAIPEERRPEIVAYGESLGAQALAELLSEGASETLRSFNIVRGALMGLPWAGRKKLRDARERGEPDPAGLGVFSSLDELTSLPAEEQEALRYLIFTHAEDPVANFTETQLIWERPEWLRPEGRHPRVPGSMRWLPGITYLQVMFDVKNATSFGPRFEALAHDYRAELPRLLRVAFGHLDVTEEQLRAIEAETARSAELQYERERHARGSGLSASGPS